MTDRLIHSINTAWRYAEPWVCAVTLAVLLSQCAGGMEPVFLFNR